MTLALGATTDHAGKVTLAVTGAAHVGTTVYTSNFSAGVDSWAGGTTGAHNAPSTTTQVQGGSYALACGLTNSDQFHFADQYVGRTVTGLTIGQSYRITAHIQVWAPGVLITVGVAGIGACTPQGASMYAWTPIVYDFVATATSHALRITNTTVGGGRELFVRTGLTVQVIAAGLGPLTMQRTDHNGVNLVRLPANAGPDATGAITVTDYEAALTGTVSYVVRDGLGFTAPATVTGVGSAVPGGALIGAAGLAALVGVPVLADYDDQRTYQALTVDPKAVIGREDFTAALTGDYGWSKRQGRLTIRAYDRAASSDDMWQMCQDIVALYTAGRVVLLRQSTYTAGMDLYHVAKAARVVRADTYAGAPLRQGWAVEVDYVETGWPAGDQVGIQWTYADLASAYLAYWNVPAAFPTYAALKTGVP